MRRALAVLMAGVWGAALVTLIYLAAGCAPAMSEAEVQQRAEDALREDAARMCARPEWASYCGG